MTVRRLGVLAECLHALVYFAPEPQRAYAELGLRGYWRGYFASRAAALGNPSAEVVTTLFGGFAPEMVRRAVPDVWTLASTLDILAARRDGATAALSRMAVADTDGRVALAAESVETTVDRLDLAGRPMAAAHAALVRPESPTARLWQGCTVLRELRGDAHLEVLATYGLPWPGPHLLLGTTGRLDPRQREYRGWSEAEWDAAAAELRSRGLLDRAAASALVEQIDTQTDDLVASAAPDVDLRSLEAALEPLAVMVSGELPFPNAMGLPPLTVSRDRGRATPEE